RRQRRVRRARGPVGRKAGRPFPGGRGRARRARRMKKATVTMKGPAGSAITVRRQDVAAYERRGYSVVPPAAPGPEKGSSGPSRAASAPAAAPQPQLAPAKGAKASPDSGGKSPEKGG